MAPIRAMDQGLDFDPLKPQSRPGRTTGTLRRAPEGGSKTLLYVSLAFNFILIALAAVLIYVLLTRTELL